MTREIVRLSEGTDRITKAAVMLWAMRNTAVLRHLMSPSIL
jgi:hypothetical protein